MKKRPEVICVGQAVVDCITRGMEEDPNGNGKVRAKSITLNLGGDAVNESFALLEMGRSAGLVCAVGKDLAGSSILSEAAGRGVDVTGVTVSEDLVTPVADILVKMDGSRSSVTSAASTLPGYRPDPAALRGARAVSLASLFRAPLDSADTIRELAAAAKREGALLFADTKIPTFRMMDLEQIADVLPLIDCIFPNETEAAYFSGKHTFPEMADVFLSMGVRRVVIKAGPEGCYAACPEERFSIPALPVPVIDTTGAGDNLVAGYIHASLDGASFREACEAGIASAARSIQHLGASRGA